VRSQCACMYVFDSVRIETVRENTDGQPPLRLSSESKVSEEMNGLVLRGTVLWGKCSVSDESVGSRAACM
jgi:hypothetical protein